MISFQVCGYSNSGKTTLIREIIKRLVLDHQKVAVIKSIHSSQFAVDKPGSDTDIFAHAGASPVIASSRAMTALFFNQKLSLKEMVDSIKTDWLILEGFHQFPLPKIVCARDESGIEAFIDRRTFALSGIIGQKLNSYGNLIVFDALRNSHMENLYRLLKEKCFHLLPDIFENTCNRCGMTCEKFTEAVIQGEMRIDDCNRLVNDI